MYFFLEIFTICWGKARRRVMNLGEGHDEWDFFNEISQNFYQRPKNVSIRFCDASGLFSGFNFDRFKSELQIIPWYKLKNVFISSNVFFCSVQIQTEQISQVLIFFYPETNETEKKIMFPSTSTSSTTNNNGNKSTDDSFPLLFVGRTNNSHRKSYGDVKSFRCTVILFFTYLQWFLYFFSVYFPSYSPSWSRKKTYTTWYKNEFSRAQL